MGFAVIPYTLVIRPSPENPIGWQVTWPNLTFATNDTGAPLDLEGFADRSIQVAGTFGSGGNVEFQGSNDGATFNVLHDPYGGTLEFNGSNRITHLTEIPMLMRPAVTAGDGTTSLTVSMFIRRTNR
jgi:hypothetical protein